MIALFRRLRHKLAHLMKVNEGVIVSRISGNSVIIGFKCDGCGEVQGEEALRLI